MDEQPTRSGIESAMALSIAKASAPTLLINRCKAATDRHQLNQSALRDLYEAAPGLHEVIQEALQSAFDADPDQVMWDSTPTADSPVIRHNLSEVAADTLRDARIAADINATSRLSVDRDGLEGSFGWTPEATLRRIHSLNIHQRFSLAHAAYWDELAQGSALSRRGLAASLLRSIVADKALIYGACGLLSNTALDLIDCVVDAPDDEQRRLAGGNYAGVKVSQVGFNDPSGGFVPFSGAWLIEGDEVHWQGSQVLYMPGLGAELRAFESSAALQAGFKQQAEHADTARELLWQLVPYEHRDSLLDPMGLPLDNPGSSLVFRPLDTDLFAYSTAASFNARHNNEWLSAIRFKPSLQSRAQALNQPVTTISALSLANAQQQQRAKLIAQPLADTLLMLIERQVVIDTSLHQGEMLFGSLAEDIPVRLRHEHVIEQEQALLGLLDLDQPNSPAPTYEAAIGSLTRLQARRVEIQQLLHPLASDQPTPQQLCDRLSSGEPRATLIGLRVQAMLLESQVQFQLGLLSADAHRLWTQAVALASAEKDMPVGIAMRRIDIGSSDQLPISGALLLTTSAALADPGRLDTVLFYLPGREGGLISFPSINQLASALGQTLLQRPDSTLWNAIASTQHDDVQRTLAALDLKHSLPLRFTALGANTIGHGLDQQIAACRASLAGNAPAKADDPAQSPGEKLLVQLEAPEHAARQRALRKVQQQRQAAQAHDKLPGWLKTASSNDRDGYMTLLKAFNQDADAAEQHLQTELPSLQQFAVNQLDSVLKRQQFDGLDPLQPLLVIPDSVAEILPPQLPRGAKPDDGPREVPSETRRTYSLMELALENIDPDDRATLLRLKHMRVLDNRWATSITRQWLSRELPALDISGAYERQINLAFNGKASAAAAPNGLTLELSVRPYRQLLALDLLGARHQGLNEAAIELLQVAASARKTADLKRDGREIELCYVELNGFVEGLGFTVLDQLRVIRDKRSDYTLIYSPGAADGETLHGFNTRKAARQALLAMAKEPIQLRYLAERVEPGQSVAIAEQRIADAARYRPKDWIAIKSTPHSDLALTLRNGRVHQMLQQVRSRSHSNRALAVLREERHEQAVLGYIALGLSNLPLLSGVADVYNGFNALHVWRENSAVETRLGSTLEIALSVIDLMTLLLVPESPEEATPGLREDPAGSPALDAEPLDEDTAPADSRDLHTSALANIEGREVHAAAPGVAAPRYIDDSFQGYEVKLDPNGAVALRGQYDLGSYRRDGVQFIVKDGKSYQVGRQKNEMTLHLRNPLTQRSGPPIRRNASGDWQYARGYGLRGAGKSAEQILSDAVSHVDQTQARTLLDQFEFPAAQKDEFERMAATAIGREQNIPAWLEKYRRATTSSAAPLQLPAAASPVQQALAELKIPGRVDILTLPIDGEEVDTWLLDNEVLYVSRTPGRTGVYTISRINVNAPSHQETVGGVLSTGVYRLRQYMGASNGVDHFSRFYAPLDDGFYRVRFDEDQAAWRVVDRWGNDHRAIYLEQCSGFSGRPRWRVAPQLDEQPRLNALTRQVLGLPATGQDAVVRRYLSAYGQQIIKATTPAIRLAGNVPHVDAMTHTFILEHGWPYPQLEQLLSARAKGLPLPDWAPQYDPLQGLVSLKSSPAHFYSLTLHAQQQDQLMLGALDAFDRQRLADLTVQSAAMEKGQRRVAHTDLLSGILVKRGFTRLNGGRTGHGVNGLDAVLIGPNGDTYVMAGKRFTRNPRGNLHSIVTTSGMSPPQLSDIWIDRQVTQSLLHFPGNPASLAVRQAAAQGRLYRLLGGITPEQEVMIFRVYGPEEPLAGA